MQQFCEPAFQPIMSCKDGARFGVEALLRLPGETTAPTRLVKQWERTGYIATVDIAVAREVLRCAQAVGYRHRMALNVSARTLADAATDYMRELTAMKPQFSRILVELTETYPVADIDKIAAFTRDCHAQGIYVGLDDCTPGHELLVQPGALAAISPKFVKIDASVVNDGFEKRDVTQLRRIARLAWACQGTTIAEGVDSLEKRNFIASSGIQYWQGFLNVKPAGLAALLKPFQNTDKPVVPSENYDSTTTTFGNLQARYA